MTNLIAAIIVSVVTNTVTNRVVESTYYNSLPCPDHIDTCLVFHAEKVNVYSETERDVTTEVVETRLLEVMFDGEMSTIERKRVLSSVVKRQVKRDEWVAE